MGDFFEIDFLDVEADKSGDAIAIRYCIKGSTSIHIVDGGFQNTGEKIANHIRKYYDNATEIDHVVVTHSDSDHTGGLQYILGNFNVKKLWMLRPWNYADEIIGRFENYTSVERLRSKLRKLYPTLSVLEEIAVKRNIPILEPFQGTQIGEFTVLAPSRERYLSLIVESERTPEASRDEGVRFSVGKILEMAKNFITSIWGDERFSSEETSAENEMSVVQFAPLCGKRILLTGDAGRKALEEAADFAEAQGIPLPGINHFQVPHHGSRRNLSTEILDRWLGQRLPSRPVPDESKFVAIISAAKNDEDHPRKAVVRACIHRGGRVLSTQGADLRIYGGDAPKREWRPAEPLPYPEEQEE